MKRLKAFPSIRKGVKDIIDAIANNTFGNDFCGASLEVVIAAFTKENQVVKGPAHPFDWKPKLRIMVFMKTSTLANNYEA